MVGRDFPPYEKTHCRISIGTMAEMQKAVDVFKKVLGSAHRRRQPGEAVTRIEKMKEDSTMSLSRRRFVQTVGAGAAGLWVAGRGREAGLFDLGSRRASTPQTARRSSCPATRTRSARPKAVLDAVRGGFGETGPLSVRHSRRDRRADRQEARREAGERAARFGFDADPAHHHARLLLEDRAARRADSGLRRVRRLRGAHGLSRCAPSS